MSQPWILITGNGGFGDTAERADLRYPVNPSSELAAELDGETVAGHLLVGRSLAWHRHPAEALAPILDEAGTPPAVILSTGVFSGRSTVSIERIAANVQDFQFADDDGYRPAGDPVYADGPTAYLATVPIKAITHAIREQGIPALLSNSASTHGCNAVMYTALHLVAERGLGSRAGFIHLPDTPGHVASLGSNGPSMDLRLQAEAVRIAAAAAIANPGADLDVPANEWEW
ncbi:hypothetical protein [Agromyces sp. NPDC060279]|uniref:pyroglutamyl-peptidase I family protein n=1 Tax=Agromyces sp. NPDC060279 TaxID=3347092 RepID=UPI00365B3E69